MTPIKSIIFYLQGTWTVSDDFIKEKTAETIYVTKHEALRF